MKIKIGKKFIGDGCPCFVIAEVGSNHNHSLKTAKKMIDVATEAKADAVKFQSIKYKELYLPKFPPKKETKKLYPRIELPEKWYQELASYAKSRNIMFLSSPTYHKAVDLLEKVGVLAYKIASPQAISNLPLVEYTASKQKPIFLSTGYCLEKDIKKAVDVCFKVKNKKIILLHCVSKYPTLPEEANLKAIANLRKKFNLITGFADHTLGWHITLAAVACGANVIEKHFTLSRKSKGPDHSTALEPKELKEMIKQIREVEAGLGSGKRESISKQENEIIPHIQTRLVSVKNIKSGEVIKESMLSFKRTPFGILVNDINKVLNRKAIKPIAKNTPLTWAQLKQ